MSNSVLSVRNLYAGYDKVETIQDISLEIEEKQVVGLVGLNGAGKTTLIKTIVDLRDVQKGEVNRKEKDLAFLPERFEAPNFLTGMEFIKFHLRSYKKEISEEKIIDQAATISLAQGALHKRIKTYSKGMRQKIGILATMLANCSLTILDEPMSGLDPKARHDVKKLIMKASENNQSILMSSHALNDVAELCDSVIIIHQGCILFSGALHDMLEKNSDKDIEQAFLNIIEGK